MKKLTNAEVKSITEPGRFRADDTLYLCVKSSGRKSWIQRIVINGRRHDLGLGPYPVVTLAEARDIALDNRRMINRGINPLADRQRTSMPTFAQAAQRFHASRKPSWKNEQHARSWMQVVRKHAFPVLADLPVDKINQRDVLAVLEDIWTEKPETARRVRQRIRSILRYCQAHNHVQQNVADERIDGALAPMPKVAEHHAALPYAEAPAAFKAIGLRVSSARLCLRFLFLTASRSNEAREAIWDEIDHESEIWKIPAARMKGGQEHRIKLTTSMLDILNEALQFNDGSGLIFPSVSKPGQPMSPDNLMKVWRKMPMVGNTTVHGLRNTFGDWAVENGYDMDLADKCLAHKLPSGVQQAYFRTTRFDERAQLMKAWDEFLRED